MFYYMLPSVNMMQIISFVYKYTLLIKIRITAFRFECVLFVFTFVTILISILNLKFLGCAKIRN
jgi:hypothetical protein